MRCLIWSFFEIVIPKFKDSTVFVYILWITYVCGHSVFVIPVNLTVTKEFIMGKTKLFDEEYWEIDLWLKSFLVYRSFWMYMFTVLKIFHILKQLSTLFLADPYVDMILADGITLLCSNLQVAI